MRTIRCILKEGKEKPLEGRHPWVFSGAIDEIDAGYRTGDLVRVYSSRNRFLGIGYLSPRSQIAIRMLAFEDVEINESFFERKIGEAVSMRDRFLAPETNAYRLVNSEGDFLPGLIVDRYNEYLVTQFLTAGMEQWKEAIVRILCNLVPTKGIYEKEEMHEDSRPGGPARISTLMGEDPPDYCQIQENGLTFLVDLCHSQKTGFFLDQRANREGIRKLSRGKRVLNCFAYTGGFSVYAASGGALETVSVESSGTALNLARENFKKNGLDPARAQWVEEDVFDYLRQTRQEFDVVILDPPAFCKSKQQIQSASRGYKDINLYALRRLASDGLLLTFSCSSYISPDLFQKIVFAAAKDARRDVQVLSKISHAFDHPINIFHPEGEYLKGFLCRVV